MAQCVVRVAIEPQAESKLHRSREKKENERLNFETRKHPVMEEVQLRKPRKHHGHNNDGNGETQTAEEGSFVTGDVLRVAEPAVPETALLSHVDSSTQGLHISEQATSACLAGFVEKGHSIVGLLLHSQHAGQLQAVCTFVC